MTKIVEVKYPRRTIIRSILKGLAKLFVSLLIDIKVNGLENFPNKGPYLVVGNHVSALEPILMLIYTPHQLEYLGTGDIPIDPRMSFFSSLYDFIPIMRGQIDQKGLKTALDVLFQNGVLGIFPEGGIWEKNLKEPKLGASWISYKSKASVVPIGFIGMHGSLQKALTLKRPKVQVNIGEVLTYDSIFPENQPLKSTMNEGAQRIMKSITSLLPDEEIINPTTIKQNELDFYLSKHPNGEHQVINFDNQDYLIKLIEHPVIMDVFNRNLKLKVGPVLTREKYVRFQDIIESLDVIMEYLDINPGFLSYRFGIESSIKMTSGINSLKSSINAFDKEYQFILIHIKDNNN